MHSSDAISPLTTNCARGNKIAVHDINISVLPHKIAYAEKKIYNISYQDYMREKYCMNTVYVYVFIRK